MNRFFILFILLFATHSFASSDVIKKSVEAVFLEKSSLQNKQVQLSGKVVKVNNGIMKRNFIHLQDGTGGKDTNNMIITSNQTANLGDQITVIGTVVLDTDFGFGYHYPLLIEKAKIVSE